MRTDDHAPAAGDLVRAPLTQADDYSPAPARVLAMAWDYEQAIDVTDAAWTRAVGHRCGSAQQAVVVRAARTGRPA